VIRALAILAALLLSACAHKPPQTYGNLDPCLVHKGTIYCAEKASKAEQDAWAAYHLAPSLDEREQEALSAFAWASAADSATTIGGLALCAGVAEANPLIAPGGGVLIVPLSYVHYRYVKRQASRTSRYMSAARPIQYATTIRAAAAASNAVVIASCL
jgi:hypothetical protein